MEQGLRSGNVVTGMYPHDVALLLREEGFPVESKFPKECAFMNVGYYACPATSPFSDLAARFIDFSLRPDIQRTFAEKMKLSPLIGRENSALDIRGFQSGCNRRTNSKARIKSNGRERQRAPKNVAKNP